MRTCLTPAGPRSAQRLGDADTSAFIAALKRWKGVLPGSYERTSTGQAPSKDA